MTDLWQLPCEAVIGGVSYPIHGDFREVLQILQVLDDPSQPEFMRWQVAVQLFYEGQIPLQHRQQAMEYLAEFISCGAGDTPGPRLMDWEQDAPVIISEVNKVAAREIRSMPFVHWWTFLGWFHAIGQGQLATLVALRDKLRRGKPLESWEKEFYRQNRSRVELKKRRTPEQQEQVARLQKLLDRGKEDYAG